MVKEVKKPRKCGKEEKFMQILIEKREGRGGGVGTGRNIILSGI
jgi:hypothetical protein